MEGAREGKASYDQLLAHAKLTPNLAGNFRGAKLGSGHILVG